MNIAKSVNLIIDQGSNGEIIRLDHKLGKVLQENGIKFKNILEKAKADYFGMIDEIDGGIPYNYVKTNPVSIFHTTVILAQLIEFGMKESQLAKNILNWLIENQDNTGLWINDKELGEMIELDSWEGDSDLGVRLFNTAFVASTISKCGQNSEIFDSISKALSTLNNYKTVKNTYIGFQQTTWIISAALNYVDIDSFNDHIVVISDYLNSVDEIRNIILILESLVGIESKEVGEIIRVGRKKLIELFEEDEEFGGWKENNRFNPGLTLSALILLS